VLYAFVVSCRRQGGYVFTGVCLFVCLLAGLWKNYSTDFHRPKWEGGVRATEGNTIDYGG